MAIRSGKPQDNQKPTDEVAELLARDRDDDPNKGTPSGRLFFGGRKQPGSVQRTDDLR